MSTIAGLPAHILLIHFVVALTPLTAILLILCALWPAARRRLIWLAVVLAAFELILTPLTVRAGQWLAGHVEETPQLDTHMSLGATAGYFAVALAVAAGLLAALHIRLARGAAVAPATRLLVVLLVVAAAGASMFQLHRIGESGARAAWGSLLSAAPER